MFSRDLSSSFCYFTRYITNLVKIQGHENKQIGKQGYFREDFTLSFLSLTFVPQKSTFTLLVNGLTACPFPLQTVEFQTIYLPFFPYLITRFFVEFNVFVYLVDFASLIVTCDIKYIIHEPVPLMKQTNKQTIPFSISTLQ